MQSQIVDRFEGLEPDRFDQTGARPLLQSLHHMLSGVGALTDPGKKSVTGLHASAVRGELRGHMGTQPTRGFDGRVQMLHQNDSASALATTCGLTAMSGCTSSMRKVCCTVWLNTGAATSPPK